MTKLHVLGIFNTITTPEYSHCAFTGKVLRFSKMMQAQGFEVVEYSNEGSQSEAGEKVVVLTRPEFDELTELYNQEYPNTVAHVGSTLRKRFEARLLEELAPRLGPDDIICHPFGCTHAALEQHLPNHFHVETSIGYDNTHFRYKIFASYAWWHYHQGKERRHGSPYEWVIPNYYDITEWEPADTPGEYILYFGRITPGKGLLTVQEIAKRTEREVIICGPGNPAPFLSPDIPNLKYMLPIKGLARSNLLRNALCTIMPTVHTEPFGGAGVEGMLCGTPFIASDYGGFSETIIPGLNGFRCKTLGDWLYAIESASSLDRKTIAEIARNRHSLETCGQLYTRVFQQILDLRQDGWYTLKPTMAIPQVPFLASLLPYADQHPHGLHF